MTLQQFHDYWKHSHAPLVKARADVLRIRKYVQNYTFHENEYSWIGRMRGAPPAFDGVAELWWDSLEDLNNRDPAATAAGADLYEDEKKFIDLKSSPIFLSTASEILNLDRDRT
jgi:uncharacterized protein (TIGR02118 family)